MPTDIVRRLTLHAAGRPRADSALLVLEAAEYINKLEQKFTMQFFELEERVLQWAMDRKIIPNSNPTAQLMKTMSELGELADATLKSNDAGIKDGVGDVLVTLLLYCKLQGISPVDCLAGAYDTIKDRRGHLTPEGIFVKEA